MPYLKVQCNYCSKETLRHHSIINKISGNSCSKSCAGKMLKGAKNPNWKGGLSKAGENGEYRQRYLPEHPRANTIGYVLEHILVAEKALGKYLAPGVVVHHINDNHAENVPGNLIICQDQAYHAFLHSRTRPRLNNGRFL